VGFGVAVQQGGLERRQWSRDKIGIPVDGEDDLGDVGGRVIDERYAGGDAAGAVDDFLAAVGAQQWRSLRSARRVRWVSAGVRPACDPRSLRAFSRTG
jgi:hypothetical protein